RTGLPARFSRIEPAHIRPRGKFDSRFRYPLNETGHSLLASLIGSGQVSFQRRRHHYAWLSNSCKKAVPKSGCYVDENSLIAHDLELLVGHLIAMLDGVCAGIDRSLNASWADRVDGDFEVLAVRFFNDSCHFRHGEVILDGNLDYVDIVK